MVEAAPVQLKERIDLEHIDCDGVVKQLTVMSVLCVLSNGICVHVLLIVEYGRVLDFRINRKTGGLQAGNNIGQKVASCITSNSLQFCK